MSQSEPDRITRLERRIQKLEDRLADLTAAGTAAPVAAAQRLAPAPVTPPAAVQLSAAPAAPNLPAATPSATAPAPARTRSFADLEEQLSSRLLAWVGGIALVLGAMFFLSLAFSRGWIGPEARVLIGFVAGAVALGAGTWLFERGDQTPATVLVGVGVGTGSLALFAASRLYGFIPIEVALIGFFVLAVIAAAIALRAGSQAVAAFGLVATTLAPPILGATPNLVTVAFLGAALVGTAAISSRRAWPWLALIAFLATSPQAGEWFRGEPSLTVVFIGILAFWLVNLLAAAGAALATDRRTVHRASATLLVLNALAALSAMHLALPDDPLLRSIGILILVSGHTVLALELLRRRPARHPFGVLVAGVALGTLAIGMAIELGGVARPIGETALALAVAWVAIHFRDRLAAVSGAAIASVALADFVFIEYPYETLGRFRPEGWAFASPQGIVTILIAAALLAVAVIAWRSFSIAPLRDRRWTAGVAFVGGCLGAIAVVGYAAVFELWADLLIVAWAALALAALAAASFVRRDARAWLMAAIGAAGLFGSAAFVAVGAVVPPSRLAVDPFIGGARRLVDGQTFGIVALAALVAALFVAGWLVTRWPPTAASGRRNGSGPRTAAITAVMSAGGLAVYLVSVVIVDAFQAGAGGARDPWEVATQAQVALSIVWVVVGAVTFAVGLIRGIGLARMFGLGLLSVAAAKVFLFDLASLDVAYRVLSLIGLGGVLLASSFVANRFRTQRPAAGKDEPAETPGPDSTVLTDPGNA